MLNISPDTIIFTPGLKLGIIINNRAHYPHNNGGARGVRAPKPIVLRGAR